MSFLNHVPLFPNYFLLCSCEPIVKFTVFFGSPKSLGDPHQQVKNIKYQTVTHTGN